MASELIEDADADVAGADEAAGAAEADDDFFFMTSSDLRRLNSSSLRLPASRDARLRSSIAEVTTVLSAVTPAGRGRWRLHSALVPPRGGNENENEGAGVEGGEAGQDSLRWLLKK